MIPADVVALCDYERHAAERIPAPLRAYIDGAGADGLTADANLAAWQAIRLQGRVLADLRGADTGLHLLGLDLPHPLILAPVAFHRLVHPEGETATVLAAGATGSLMVVSTQASLPLEQIATAAHGPLWFQLYMQPRREDTLRLVRRAEDAGYRALVVGGPQGVAHMLTILRAELEVAMALTGCRDLAGIDEAVLWQG